MTHHKDTTDPSPKLNQNPRPPHPPPLPRAGLLTSHTEPTNPLPTTANPPTYVPVILSTNPSSGALQFWTISLTLLLTPATSADTYRGPPHERRRLGLFGRSERELPMGTVTV